MKTGIAVLDKYAVYYLKKLTAANLHVTPDEISSELGEAYAASLQQFNEDDQRACFETYVIRAFINAMKKFRAQKIQDAFLFISESALLEPQSSEWTALDAMLYQDSKRQLMGDMETPRTLIICNEMLNPSAKVVDMVEAIKQHFQGVNYWRYKGGGIFRKAISLVYGYSDQSVRYHMHKVKKITKKLDIAIDI